jgi:hypothetical protein
MATAQSPYYAVPDKSIRPGDPYTYQVGFGNSFATEAIPGVLPLGQNSPQKGSLPSPSFLPVPALFVDKLTPSSSPHSQVRSLR